MNEIKISVSAYKELIDDNIKLTKERKELLEERDDKDEIIQSLHDEIEARNSYTQKVIAQRNHLQEEIIAMAKDHEDEIIDRINSSITKKEIRQWLSTFIDSSQTNINEKIVLLKFYERLVSYIDSKQL